jgi:uncharacterized membrane protein (DUF373 family)
MRDLWPRERAVRGFERVVLSAVQILLMLLVAIATADLFYLLYRGVQSQLLAIESVGSLQKAMQRGFAGILLILIGMELLETVRAYLQSHRVRLEVVLIVAVIAVGRHILDLDLQDVDGVELLGFAALILALTVGYFLVRFPVRTRGQTDTTQPSAPDDTDS